MAAVWLLCQMAANLKYSGKVMHWYKKKRKSQKPHMLGWVKWVSGIGRAVLKNFKVLPV